MMGEKYLIPNTTLTTNPIQELYDSEMNGDEGMMGEKSVSYTHLTLPTKA